MIFHVSSQGAVSSRGKIQKYERWISQKNVQDMDKCGQSLEEKKVPRWGIEYRAELNMNINIRNNLKLTASFLLVFIKDWGLTFVMTMPI